jgi:hypothetical protein
LVRFIRYYSSLKLALERGLDLNPLLSIRVNNGGN